MRREFLQLLLQPRTFVKFSQVLLENVATRSIGRVTLLLLLLLLLLAHGFFCSAARFPFPFVAPGRECFRVTITAFVPQLPVRTRVTQSAHVSPPAVRTRVTLHALRPDSSVGTALVSHVVCFFAQPRHGRGVWGMCCFSATSSSFRSSDSARGERKEAPPPGFGMPPSASVSGQCPLASAYRTIAAGDSPARAWCVGLFLQSGWSNSSLFRNTKRKA